jgi:putative flippase GtrA
MRAARFVGVGFVGFAVQMVALHVLTKIGVPAGIAIAAAVELAILHNFVWHERWTWGDRLSPIWRFSARRRTSWIRRSARGATAIALRFVRFNIASGAVSIVGNVVLTGLFVGALHLPLLVANTLAVITLSAVNYVVADRFVFYSLRSDTIGSMRAARRAGT